LLTPIYTAGAIAEEKERRTLELLFGSGLTSREIVLGKLASRTVHILILLFSGLPVVMLLPALGPVDPERVMIGFATMAISAVSVASVGVYLSITAKRPLEAIFTTYGSILGYLFLSAALPGVNLWFKVLLPATTYTTSHLAESLVVYATAHVVIAGFFAAYSVQQLRALARRHADGVRDSDDKEIVIGSGLPEIPVDPVSLVVWKEQNVEKNLIGDQQVLACLGVPLVFYLFMTLTTGAFSGEGERTLRIVGMCFAIPLPILVGLSAAGRISREYERTTLDSLLTATFDRNTLLLGKAWASFSGVYILVAVLALATGSLSFFAVPFLAVAVVIHTAFAAFLGLYFSAVCQNTIRAMIATLIALVGVNLLIVFLPYPWSFVSPPSAFWALSVDRYAVPAEVERVPVAFAVTLLIYGIIGLALLWRFTLDALAE
jgi:ABC-type transport system involved in multi-copper enzyme maturation permease subunit